MVVSGRVGLRPVACRNIDFSKTSSHMAQGIFDECPSGMSGLRIDI